jgi:hypothetical protein
MAVKKLLLQIRVTLRSIIILNTTRYLNIWVTIQMSINMEIGTPNNQAIKYFISLPPATSTLLVNTIFIIINSC